LPATPDRWAVVSATAANALWGVEALLVVFFVKTVRERHRLERLGAEVSEAAGSGPSVKDDGVRSQWASLARQLRAEGKSAAQIEQIRKQLFSA
jgi:hypothetical protein